MGRVVVVDLLDDWHGVPLLLASFFLGDWTGAGAVHSVCSRTRLVVDLGPMVKKLTAVSLPVVVFLVFDRGRVPLPLHFVFLCASTWLRRPTLPVWL